MNRMSWMGLTVLLAGGALFSTSAMRRLSQPLPPFTGRYAAASDAGKADRPGVDEARAAAKSAATEAELVLDDLWEKSLFHHERTEKNGGAGSAPEPEAQAPSEFELVGIARIGQPGQAQAVAIIKQEQAASRTARLAAARARTVRSRTVRAASTPTPEPEETPKKPVKKMFRVGDAVNDTGYVVKSIDPDTNTVILNKGSEEITLKIELADKKNSARRQEAVNQELSVREKYKAQAEAVPSAGPAASTPAAPGAAGEAPPATAGPGAGGAGGMPPPPPGGFVTRGVRINPNAPGSRPAAGAEPGAEPGAEAGSAGSAGVNNPMVDRMRQSNRPGQGRTSPAPQP